MFYHSRKGTLLKVLEVKRQGFQNFVKAQSISPPLDEPVFLTFISAKIIPASGEYFSFSGTEASFINPETFAPRNLKTNGITPEEYAAVGA